MEANPQTTPHALGTSRTNINISGGNTTPMPPLVDGTIRDPHPMVQKDARQVVEMLEDYHQFMPQDRKLCHPHEPSLVSQSYLVARDPTTFMWHMMKGNLIRMGIGDM